MFAVANEVTIHYRRIGRADAPRLVFLNSLGSDLRIWDEVTEVLRDRFDVLLIDMRGHGLTEVEPGPVTIPQLADDLLALLDHVGWRKASIVGLSIGGLIALHAAIYAPQRVERLVLMDTAAKIGDSASWTKRIAAVEDGGVESIADAVTTRWFSDGFAEREPGRFAAWRHMFAATSSTGYRSACEAILAADYTDEVHRITAPTLALAGDGDVPTPPALVRGTAESIPGARFEAICGAGHLPCLERPIEVARAIADHLHTVESVCDAGTDRFRTGMATRRGVLGDTHVDRANAAITPFDAAFQRFITESAWGTVWSSPRLTRRERSMLTIALLAALGQDDEVAMHVRATASTGASATDIAEALMHVAVYAGVPAANHAIKIAKKTLAEMEAASQ